MGSTFEVDIIVVGGGGSGLAAAVAAAEQGAKVLVLEKKANPGGTTNFPAGIFAVESKMQKEKGIPLTKDEVFTRMMEYSHYRSNAVLTRAIIDKSASTLDWLQEHGVEFIGPQSTVPGEVPTWHLIKGAGAAMVKSLVTKAKDMGIDIHLNVSVKTLLKDKDRIAGVMAVIDGKDVEIKGKAVILATGGFGSNKEWVKKYTGLTVGEDLFPTVNVGLMGDGQRMAWEVGAVEDGMGLLEIEYCLNGQGLKGTPFLRLAIQPYLWVNLQGERLGNEDRLTAVANYAGNVLNRQAKKQAFLIFDAKTKKHMETKGFDRKGPPILGSWDTLVDLDGYITEASAAGNKNVFAAHSLEDLCAQTGIKPDGLEETLKRYNNMAEKKLDDQFAKDPELLQPIQQAPFYALRIQPSMLGTLGGIKVNSKLEVLDPEDNNIPGLYAVGNIASGMYGDTYCIVFGGTTLGFAINSGRMSGENAAHFTKALN